MNTEPAGQTQNELESVVVNNLVSGTGQKVVPWADCMDAAAL